MPPEIETARINEPDGRVAIWQGLVCLVIAVALFFLLRHIGFSSKVSGFLASMVFIAIIFLFADHEKKRLERWLIIKERREILTGKRIAFWLCLLGNANDFRVFITRSIIEELIKYGAQFVELTSKQAADIQDGRLDRGAPPFDYAVLLIASRRDNLDRTCDCWTINLCYVYRSLRRIDSLMSKDYPRWQDCLNELSEILYWAALNEKLDEEDAKAGKVAPVPE